MSGATRESPARFGRRAAGAGGFTLVELLVVLAVLALLAGFALPAVFSGNSGAELRVAARNLAAGLRHTRSHAVTGQRPAALVIDVERRVFELPGESRARSLQGGFELSLVTARSEKSAPNRGSIRFFPDGSSTGGRIILAGETGTLLIDVGWLTGGVRVLDGAGDLVADSRSP